MTPITTLPTQARKVSPLNVMAERFHIEPVKLFEVLKATVIKGSDKRPVRDEEVAAFVMVANQYDLNPFTREIHAFIGKSGGVVPIVGIDGWVKLVNRHGDFDGCQFEEHSDDHGTPICTTCTMHVRGRQHPIRVTEWFSECRRDTDPWRTMPHRMLRHKAYMQAARLCFGFAGIYDEDEGQTIAGVATVRSETSVDALASKLQHRAAALANPPEPDVESVPSGQQFPDEAALRQPGEEG